MASRNLFTSVLTVYLLLRMNFPSQSQSYSQTNLIFKDKLDPSVYNTEIRPLLNQSEVVNVEVLFELISIVEINDVTQSFIVNGCLISTWTDEIVVWDPDDYGGQRLINPLPKQIWRPKVVLLNTLGARDPFDEDDAPVFMQSNGLTSWTAGSLFSSSCQLNLASFPFDQQTCVIKLAAMKYTEDELKFIAYYPNISQTYFTAHGEWIIDGTDLNIVSIISGPSKASVIELTFHLRRRPSFLVVSILLPVMFLSFLNILTFFIPVESGEKISYGITVLLALSVYMSMVSGMLPRASVYFPDLTIYLFILLVMSMLTVINCIIVVLLHHKDEKIGLMKKVKNERHVATSQPNISPMDTSETDNFKNVQQKSSLFSVSSSTSREEKNGNKNLYFVAENDPKIIKTYTFIGKQIDAVSFVVFFVFWLFATLGFLLHMSLA